MSGLRRLKRGVMHYKMKKAGCVQVNKHTGGLASFFSKHWRDKRI